MGFSVPLAIMESSRHSDIVMPAVEAVIESCAHGRGARLCVHGRNRTQDPR